MLKAFNALDGEFIASKSYQEDDDFKDEDKTADQQDELKDDYYYGEMFNDNPDYIFKDGQKMPAVCYKDNQELFFYGDSDFNEDELKALDDFYKNGNAEDSYTPVWNWETEDDIKVWNDKINKARLAIKYRGGQGYAYGWHILKAD